MSLQNPHWYDYINPLFWIELVMTAQVIRSSYALKSELKRRIAPELKEDRFLLIKLMEVK